MLVYEVRLLTINYDLFKNTPTEDEVMELINNMKVLGHYETIEQAEDGIRKYITEKYLLTGCKLTKLTTTHKGDSTLVKYDLVCRGLHKIIYSNAYFLIKTMG